MPDDPTHATLDFQIKGDVPSQRGRYRVVTCGLSLFLDDVSQAFDIHDLSSSGCHLYDPAGLLAVGRIFDSDLHIGDTSYLADLKVKVIRRTNYGVACAFQALNDKQEAMLDKLLLELQKREIATQSAQRKREKYRWQNMVR